MENKTRYSEIIKINLIVAIFILGISLALFLTYTVGVKNNQKENQIKTEALLKNIEIKSNKNDKYKVVFASPDRQVINANLEKNYLDFLIQYNQNQSQWLNAWLTIMAISLAFLGLIAPICFMKLYEDKKTEMDKIISDAKEQKNETQINVDKMANQLEEVECKSEKMTEKLKAVETYLNETKATSKYSDAVNLFRDKKLDEAENLLIETTKLKDDYDSAYRLLSSIYIEKKMFTKAQEAIKKAINIKPKESEYITHLSYCYQCQSDYSKALESINEAIQLEPKQAYNFARKAYIYAKLKEPKKSIENIKTAMSLKSSDPEVFDFLGLAEIDNDNLKSAIEYFTLGLKIGKSPSLYYNLTEAFIFDEQIINALDSLNEYESRQNKFVYGIYNDDYDNWTAKIKTLPQDDNTKELLSLIDIFEKKQRS